MGRMKRKRGVTHSRQKCDIFPSPIQCARIVHMKRKGGKKGANFRGMSQKRGFLGCKYSVKILLATGNKHPRLELFASFSRSPMRRQGRSLDLFIFSCPCFPLSFLPTARSQVLERPELLFFVVVRRLNRVVFD